MQKFIDEVLKDTNKRIEQLEIHINDLKEFKKILTNKNLTLQEKITEAFSFALDKSIEESLNHKKYKEEENNG